MKLNFIKVILLFKFFMQGNMSMKEIKERRCETGKHKVLKKKDTRNLYTLNLIYLIIYHKRVLGKENLNGEKYFLGMCVYSNLQKP